MSMYQTKTFSIWLQIGVILAFFFLAGGLFFASYSAGFALLTGIFLGLLTILILWSAKTLWQKGRQARSKLITFLIILLFIALLCYLQYILFLPLGLPPQRLLFDVKSYHIFIEPVDETLEKFRVNEEIILMRKDIVPNEEITFSMQGAPVTNSRIGLLLKEVNVELLRKNIDLTFSDGTSLSGHLPGDLNLVPQKGASLRGYICCFEPNVELLNFPKGSFYAVKEAEILKRYPYIDTETITWVTHNSSLEVTFAFIPPPYYYLQPVLDPFVHLSSLGQFVLTLIGMFGTFVIVSIIKPVMIDTIRSKFKSYFEKKLEKRPVTKAKLIISSKGEEKEIEIDE